MRKRDYISTSFLLLATIMLAANVTTTALLNRPLLALPEINWSASKKYAASGCGSDIKIDNLSASADPKLRKMAEYQTVCGSMPASRVMIFSDMPNSDANAVQKATQMAATLQEFAKYKVAPLVVIEPVSDWGYVDFTEFHSGLYDQWIDTYFKTLKAQGITDQHMGMWVPFPEANLPYWNHANSKPADFAADVTLFVTYQKKYFPGSKASVMLNSATYANDDFDWRNGEYTSLIPYVKDIPKGLIDSFGFQGFPWMPAADQGGSGVLDAGQYLDGKLAREAADALGVRSIWFNTGSFGRKYTLEPAKQVVVPAEQRKDILTGIATQAQKLKGQGYEVSVNLFAENKAGTQEDTDWSFWPQGKPQSTPDSVVFADFATSLRQAQVSLWLFDTEK